MTGLHKFFEAFYDGVGTAATQWALNLGQFTSVFSPILDDLAAIDREKQTLDVVLLVTGVLAVALFEVIVRRSVRRLPSNDTNGLVVGPLFVPFQGPSQLDCRQQGGQRFQDRILS